LALTGCVTERSPVTGKPTSLGFSWSQEQQIGKESDAQVIQEYGVYDDPEVQAYVNRVAQSVLANSDLRDEDAPEMYRNTPFTFRVLDSPVVNAFALPGGYVYVTRGLLAYTENEAQLATVLGHEIGHVAARHSARQAVKSQFGQLGVMAGAVLGSQVLGDPAAAQNIMNVGGQAFQLLLTKYSRDDEREADRLGMEYAARRGYDVVQVADFFKVLDRVSSKEGVRLPSWQSTHPDPGEREATALAAANKYHPAGAMLSVGQDSLLQHLDGLVAGEDPRQGFVDRGYFYHPEMGFQFAIPQGWKVKNERSAVLLAPSSGNALVAFQLAPGKSLSEAQAALGKQEGFQIAQSSPTSINGNRALAFSGSAQLQQGTAALQGYLVEFSNRVFAFMGLSSSQTRAQFEPDFSRIAQGFQRLRDPAILNAQPARLQVVTVQQDTPLASFMPTGPVFGLTLNDLAILNNMNSNQTVPAGTKLKVLRVGENSPIRGRPSNEASRRDR
jgi:predicted Zn-dependent protease